MRTGRNRRGRRPDRVLAAFHGKTLPLLYCHACHGDDTSATDTENLIVLDMPAKPQTMPEDLNDRTMSEMLKNAQSATDLVKAVAHEGRLIILCMLAEKERSVTDLEQILSLNQPSVSQQLARLRSDGLVDTRRDGKTIYYSLASENARKVVELLYDLYCKPRVP